MSRRAGVGRLIIAVIVIGVLLVAAGTTLIFSQPGASTASSDSTATTYQTGDSATGAREIVSQQNTSTTLQLTITFPSGLELLVELNETVLGPDGALGVRMSLFNSLDQNLSLATAYPQGSLISLWNGYDFPCGESPVSSLVGFAIFQGHYTAKNVSVAEPLQLAPPVPLGCVTHLNPYKAVFLPDNDTAVLYSADQQQGVLQSLALPANTESCAMSSSGSYGCSIGDGLTGFWDTTSQIDAGNATARSGYLGRFAPGEYTLTVEDMWNQTSFAYFQVLPQSMAAQLVSLVGPTPPFAQGAASIGIILENVADLPITSLDATLVIRSQSSSSYTFAFDVSPSHPLLPGEFVYDTLVLTGPGFNSSLSYPLTIEGVLGNGIDFGYTTQVQMRSPD